MKKLFGGGSSGRAAGRKEASGPLTNKTVQVGSYQVLCGTLLGSGGYADIYSVVDISTGGRFALKHLRLAGEPETISEVQREAKTMARLKGHPNILRLHAVAFAGPRGGETDGFFLLELCPGSLLDLMARHAYQLDDATVLHVFGCVVAAVAHMHGQQPPLAHRDLKAENVLMRPDGTWVLCDYGSATARAGVYDSPEAMASEEEVIRRHTTPAYRPPEMWDLYLRQPIDTKVDIWALGVLLYVLCFGRLPFTGDSKLAVLNAKYELPASRPPQLRALIRQLLEPDPAQRPDVTALSRQLEDAARAITGRGLPQLRPAATSGNSSGSSSTTATAAGNSKPAAPPQPQQQQQQQASSAVASGPPPAKADAASAASAAASPQASGSFWTTADATAASGQQQLQQPQPDWAKFSSDGVAGKAPAAAASSAGARGQGAAARPAPHARPPAGTPAAAASPAAAAHSSSPAARHSASQQHSPNSNGSLPAGANGHGSVSANGGHQSFQQPQQPQQCATSSDGQLSRLADITARAAQAAQAAAASRIAAAQQQQQQSPGIAAPAAHDTTGNSRRADSGSFVAERVPQPYASVSGSVENIRPSSGGSSDTRGHSGSSSSAAAPMDWPKEAPANSRVGSTSGAARDAAAPSTAANMVRPSTSQQQQQQQRQQQQQQPRPAPAAVRTAAGAVTAAAVASAAAVDAAGGGGVTAAALAELRAAVFGELDLLRAQVVSLADAEQAFLVRIKQLEEYGQQQHEAVGRLQQQVASLQQQLAGLQQQQHLEVPAGSADPMSADGAAERHGWLRGITRSSRASESGAAVPSQPSDSTSIHPQRSAAGAGTFWSLQHSEDVL